MKSLTPLQSFLHITRLLAAAAALAAPGAFAEAFTGTYTFGSAGNVASFDYNGTPISDLTVSAITKVGITTSSSTNNFRGTNWSTGATDGSDTFTGTLDAAKYIEFTLTAAAGKVINFPTLTFGLGRSGTGPRQWQWRSSVDGYTNPIPLTTVASGLTHVSGELTNPDSNSSWTGNAITTSGAAYQNLSSITFRLYGYNAEATTGTGGLQGALTFGGALDDVGGGDTVPPSVVSLSPSDNSNAALTNTKLVLTYDEAVKAGAGSATIRKLSDDTLVDTINIPGSQFSSAAAVATLSLSADLEINTDYYVELSAGAITDLFDNPAPAINGNSAWNFTTRGAPQLLISQYYEGSGQDRYIELKNLTGSPLALDGYRVVAWSDTAPSDNEGWKSGTSTCDRVTDLTGKTIPANGTFLIAEVGALAPTYAANNNDLADSSGCTAFNGNDSVVLYFSGLDPLGFTQEEVVDAVSFVANDGADKSFYRLNDSPGFDFASGTSILNYPGVWAPKSIPEVDSATSTDEWYLKASNPPGTLALTINPSSVSEAAGTGAATATVTRSGDTSEVLFVTIVTTGSKASTALPFVEIQSGFSSADFTIDTIDDPWLTGDATVTFSVSASGYLPTSEQLIVLDQESDTPFPVVINEVDADTPGADADEFVELYNTSNQVVSLDGTVLVLFNGNGDVSYKAIDLTGYSIPANDYFVIGSATVPEVDLIVFDTDVLQNGADAMALCSGTAAGFPNGTPVSATAGNLIDALVYGTNDADDNELLTALLPVGKPQVNESLNADSANESMSRVPDGGAAFDTTLYAVQIPTPGATNVLAPANTFASWLSGFDFSAYSRADLSPNGDADNDGLPNSVENILGTSPAAPSQGLTGVASAPGTLSFQHTLNATPASDLTPTYEWSADLVNWNASGASAGGVTVSFGTPVVDTPGTPDLVQVTATISGSPAAKVFARLKVTQP